VWAAVQWVQGDLFDPVALAEGMENQNVVIHCAGLVSFHSSERALLYRTNVEGTANVVNTALECAIPRLVHVSSVAAIGRSLSGTRVNETHKWDPQQKTTHYARSKYEGELEVWRGIAEGLNAVIVNPSTVLGYGDWNHTSCALFRNAYREFPWYTNGINGFVDVEDVASATIQLMKSSLQSERYILNGENWPFQQLFNVLADVFGKKRPFRFATPLLTSLAWRAAAVQAWLNGEKPLLTRESAKMAHSQTFFNNEKLLQALPGFQFTPLTTTLEKACDRYRQHIGQLK
jgi:nucleoside-diphosphate-sugar epimerase